MRKRIAAAALTASLLGGGAALASFSGLPVAFAQTGSEPTATAKDAWVTDVLSGLVTNGTLT
ncbi:MAG: hypothetical protein ACRD0M_09970, partial [Acidimicrobiales bacterium]